MLKYRQRLNFVQCNEQDTCQNNVKGKATSLGRGGIERKGKEREEMQRQQV
jgi:hypothetical protein